jgi:dihydroflavonol-4-reductase
VNGPVFVTGGSGFVGGALIRGLVARGIEVRALARSAEAADAVGGLGAAPVLGDLEDARALEAGMRGCDVVFHAAGVNQMCTRDPAPMYRANVEGAGAVVRAGAAVGVDRIVHTSSASTIGEERGTIGHEDAPHRGSFLSHYERSKYLGEREAFELGERLEVGVVSVNPSSVQGPGRTTGTARLLLRAARAKTATLVRTDLSIVDVDDCTRGHLLAAVRGGPGERYLLSGLTLSTEEAVDLVRVATGRPEHVVWVPRGLVRTAAAFTALIPGAETPVCPALLRTLLHGHRYDGSRAARTLGLTYTSIQDTIAKTVTWYREQGLLHV